MAIHKRSFKCFDALLDDLSQKVPLPFGVRTVTTPRGVHSISHLEQLQDGGCYLCSDRRHAKPINMELAGKRPAIWHHHTHRHGPAPAPPPPSHAPHRQRRVLLVRNGEPGVRRHVVLGRRAPRSLPAFLEDISELMQFHVRRLYTVEGRKIDSVQSLMTCPGVLVCVGREPFSPTLVDFLRKSSEDKLPGLGCRTPGNGARSPATQGTRSPPHGGARSPPHGARSRASEYSEGQESRKSVNFGLETKKSIIHPRSDSSNRSTRFSLSSEKSYPNGPGAWSHSQARPSIMNDDIEKRVLVNKDGSLSVEMRVRFRLRNDETLQWSTEIKKSPPGSLTNDCCSQPCYLQHDQSETCSDQDSPEVAHYNGQPLQRPLDESQCSCCYQRQERHYDMWENPADSHDHPAVPCPPSSKHTHTRVRQTHSSSSSSSCHSRRVLRRRLGSRGGSASDQGRVVQEEMCVHEQVQRRVEVEQDGDTRVEVSTVSRCCSCSGVTATDSNLRSQSRRSPDDHEGGASQCHAEPVSEGEQRPLSAVSNSSHVLQTLLEDHDDEEDLPPSASRCCNSDAVASSQAPQTCLTPCPPSRTDSRHSAKHRTNSQHSLVREGEEAGERGSGAGSVASSCHCGVATPHSTVGGEEQDRAASSRSKTSPACSHRSAKTRTPDPEEDEAADDEDEEWGDRALSGLSNHTGLSVGSGQSEGSTACPHCGTCKRGSTPGSGTSAMSKHRAEESISRASQGSHHSHDSQCEATATPTPVTPPPNTNDAEDGVEEEVERAASGMSHVSEGSVKSTLSNKSNCTNRACSRMTAQADRTTSRASNTSRCSRSATPLEQPGNEEEEEERPATSVSQRSARSHESGSNGSARAMSAESNVSAKTSASAKSDKSHRSNCDTKDEERAGSVLSTRSAKSNVSAKSSKSHNSSQSARTVSPGCNAADEPVVDTTGDAEGEIEPAEEEEMEERAASAMSAQSNVSAKTSASAKSDKSHRSNCDTKDEERAASVLSTKSAKSNASAKSSKSHNSSQSARTVSPGCDAAAVDTTGDAEGEIEPAEEEETEERAASAMSAQSNLTAKSGKSHTSGKASEGTLSPGSEAEENTEDVEVVGEGTEAGGADHEDGEEAEGGAADHEDRAATVLSTKSRVNEGRAASALSTVSARSGKSHRPNCPRAASPNKDVSEMKDDTAERAPSAMSTKSDASAKSTEAHMTNSEAPCQGPNAAVIPTIKTDEGEEENEGQTVEGGPSEQRAPSSLSVRSTKSNISAKSSKTHRSTCKHADLLTTNGGQEDRAGSAMSVKSTSSSKTHRSTCKQADLLTTNGGQEDRAGSAMSVKSTSSSKTHRSTCKQADLLTTNGGQEDRAGSAMSVKSTSSSKTHRSTCKQTDLLTTDGGQEDRAGSAMSVKSTSSSKTHRSTAKHADLLTTNGGQEDRVGSAMSVKSTSSSKTHRSTNKHADLLTTDVGQEDRAGSAMSVKSTSSMKSSKSRKSNHNESVRAVSPNPNVAQIVTIEMPEVVGPEGEDEEKTEERAAGAARSHVSVRSSKSVKSTKSHKSGCCGKAEIPAIEMTDADEGDVGEAVSDGSAATPTDTPPAEGGNDEEEEEERERAASVLSAKSCVKCSRSIKSASPMPPNGPKDHDDNGGKGGNNLKTPSHLDAPESRASSAMSSSSKVRSKSPAKAVSKPTISETPPDSETRATSRPASRAKDDIAPEKAPSVRSKSHNSLRPESAASAHPRPKLKEPKEGKGEEKSNGTSQHLDVTGDYVKSRAPSESGSVRSVRTAKSEKKATLKESPRPKSRALSERPVSNSKPAIVVESSSGTLSKSLSAADLLRETMAAARPPSCQSKASSINDKTNSEMSGRSYRSRVWNEEEAERAMTPAYLPNASPNEVVSDWLRNIPANGCMYTFGDGTNEGAGQEGEEEPGEEAMKEDTDVDDEKTKEEAAAEEAEPDEGGDGNVEEEEADASSHARGSVLPSSNDLLSRNCHSSVAVMKVLLSPCLERCHSMPEVSPVHGRRLSTSAKGLLDCLAQLQLIDPTPSPGCNRHKDRDRRYNEIVAILQSLWLSEPQDKDKEGSKEQVTPPRSSSGVDVRSGSAGSGKDNGNGGDETPAKAGEAEEHECQAAGGDEEEGETGQEEAAGEVEAGEEEAGEEEAVKGEVVGQEEEGKEEAEEEEADKLPEASSDRAEEDDEQPAVSPSPPADGEDISDSPKATETPCSSDNTASKSPTDNERETLEDSSSGGGTPLTVPPLTKLKSQDPDPVWVLNLLKKLEKQFMGHYVDAMVEFKVRWDLDDSVILDTMITELRDEVSRRIQSSIERELRKIQGRAGRTGHSPRPPAGDNLSRESTMTDKRRKMLKVLKNQTAKTADSLSVGELTPEFSDDDYCPCEACVRKKMAARPVKMHVASAPAPVIMEFDLRKILQRKKDPEPGPVVAPPPAEEEAEAEPEEEGEEDGRNLEIVQEEEEEEEAKDVIPTVVVEETTAADEEEEEVEEEEGEEEEEEEEGEAEEGEGDVTCEEGEEKAEDDGEKAEEEEAENEEEEEEEGEQAACDCGADEECEEEEEEEGGEAGEEEEEGGGEAGEEEEEPAGGVSDGEAAEEEEEGGEEEEEGGEEGGKEEEEEDGEEEECMACKSMVEEGEVTERESGGEGEGGGEGEAEDVDDDGDGEGDEDEKSGEAEAQEGEESEVEAASPQEGEESEVEAASPQEGEESEVETAPPQVQEGPPVVCVTEGSEEEDAENEDAVEDVVEDVVEELKPQEKKKKKRAEDGVLLHQQTKTSMESQPGSLEEAVDSEVTTSALHPVSPTPARDAGKVAAGGGQRRSRSPGRTKRRRPKESDVEPI